MIKHESSRLAQKVINIKDLPGWAKSMRDRGIRVVATNGCFDILHVGHVFYLEQARTRGDALVVGINDDRSVRELKGETRPFNTEADRANMIAALESVDKVCIFSGRTAAQFLKACGPDVWVKGGDYDMDSLDETEKWIVQLSNGKIEIIPFTAGKSTTSLVSKIRNSPVVIS